MGETLSRTQRTTTLRAVTTAASLYTIMLTLQRVITHTVIIIIGH